MVMVPPLLYILSVIDPEYNYYYVMVIIIIVIVIAIIIIIVIVIIIVTCRNSVHFLVTILGRPR